MLIGLMFNSRREYLTLPISVFVALILAAPLLGQFPPATMQNAAGISIRQPQPPSAPSRNDPSWAEPIRISQAAPSAGPAAPAARDTGIAPPAERTIQPIRPLGEGPVHDVDAPAFQIPFQQRLPPELLPKPTTPATKEEFDRFIPQVIDPQQQLNLIVGMPRILTFAEWATKPEVRLYLPDEEIARWDIISDTEVALIGLQPGTTVLTVWFNDPTVETGKRVLSFRVRVYEDPQFRETLTDLEAQVAEIFPDSHVKLSIVRNRLVVRGQAKDAIEAGQILTLLAQTRRNQQNGVDGDDTSIANFYIDQDQSLLEDQAALRRSVIDSAAVARAGIVNLLQIPGEQQVTLRVTLAEVNRSALRSIGANVEIGGAGDVSFVSLLLPSGFNATTGGNLSVNKPDFRLALHALRDLGYARTLAEPNLTALNGRPASFRAGDTFPVPNAQASFGGVGQGVSQQFVGVEVQFIPYIVDRDRIRLQVQGEVSARDDAQSANIAGTNVPGQNTRNFTTTVELRDGQTMAMAGLLQTTLAGDAKRIPFLGDLPVIGTLFTSKRNSATEQELVILVTPELAHPLENCETPPLPGSDLYEPTDAEFYIANRIESRRSKDFRSPVRTDYQRIKQVEKCCFDRYIIGPSGYCCGSPTNSSQEFRAQMEQKNLPRQTELIPAPPPGSIGN